jgi:hypothetical protein
MEKSQVKAPYRIKFMRPKSGSFLSSADLQLIKIEEQEIVSEEAKGFEASVPPKIEPTTTQEPKVSE